MEEMALLMANCFDFAFIVLLMHISYKALIRTIYKVIQ